MNTVQTGSDTPPVTYRQLLRRPYLSGLLFSAVLVRLAAGMVPFGIVAALTEAGHTGLAGLGFASFLIMAAATGPWRGRLVDRAGALRVLPALTGVFVTLNALAALAVPHAALLAIGCVALGAALAPPAAPLLRSTWTAIGSSGAEVRALHSLDSVLEEGTFVLTPLLTSAIWVVIGSRWALLAGAAATGAGITLLLIMARRAGPTVWDQFARSTVEPDATPATEQPLLKPTPDARPEQHPTIKPAPVVRTRSGLALLAPMAGLGVSMGALATVAPAWARQHGSAPFSGILLAAISLAGMLAGLVYGRTHLRVTRRHQYSLAGLLVAGGVVIVAISPWPTLAVTGTILVGIGMTPMFIVAYLLVGDIVPRDQHTEANSALGSAYNFGSGGAAAVAGFITAHTVANTALWTAAATTAAAALIPLLLKSNDSLSRTP
jgi:MFS family permease